MKKLIFNLNISFILLMLNSMQMSFSVLVSFLKNMYIS